MKENNRHIYQGTLDPTLLEQPIKPSFSRGRMIYDLLEESFGDDIYSMRSMLDLAESDEIRIKYMKGLEDHLFLFLSETYGIDPEPKEVYGLISRSWDNAAQSIQQIINKFIGENAAPVGITNGVPFTRRPFVETHLPIIFNKTDYNRQYQFEIWRHMIVALYAAKVEIDRQITQVSEIPSLLVHALDHDPNLWSRNGSHSIGATFPVIIHAQHLQFSNQTVSWQAFLEDETYSKSLPTQLQDETINKKHVMRMRRTNINGRTIPVFADIRKKDFYTSIDKILRKKVKTRSKGEKILSFPDIRDTIGGMFVVCGSETDLNNLMLKVFSAINTEFELTEYIEDNPTDDEKSDPLNWKRYRVTLKRKKSENDSEIPCELIFMLLEDYLDYHYKIKRTNAPFTSNTAETYSFDDCNNVHALDGQFRAKFEIERLKSVAELLFPRALYGSINHDRIAEMRTLQAAQNILKSRDYTNSLLLPNY